MKKLTYLSSAIAAALGFSATANADISVSGSGSLAVVSDPTNSTTEVITGGGVAFALSTTTANGLGISAGFGITRDTDGADTAAGATGGGSMTFTSGGSTIVVGAVGAVGNAFGNIGGAAGAQVDLADGVAAAAGADITVTTGHGVTLSTTVGGAALTIGYIFDGVDNTSVADNVGNTDTVATATGATVSMPMGDVTVGLGYGSATDANTETSVGATVGYAAGGGTLTLGYGQSSLNGGNATYMGATYAMSLDADTSLTLGYNSTKDATNSNTQAEVGISRSLGGGASAFLDVKNVNGDGNNTGTAFAIGSSVAF
jgi:hypothetical protein